MITANNLRFLKSIVLSNIGRLRFPFKISFAVTYHCNFKCRMCNIWKKNEKTRELSLEEINTFFKRAPDASWIGITGGEPFLRDDLLQICENIIGNSKKLSTLHFATNGYLSTTITHTARYLRKKYKKLNLAFSISIDGPPHAHDRIRGKEGAWNNATHTFLELKNIPDVDTHIGFTLSAHNTGLFKDTYLTIKSLLPSLAFNDFNVNVFQKSGFYYDNEEMPDLEAAKLEREIKEILLMDRGGISIKSFLRRVYLKLYPRYCKTKQSPLKCQAFSSTCYLDPYGNLFPCIAYKKNALNIRSLKDDFYSFWNSPDAKTLAYECSQNNCPGCWSPCDAFSAIAGFLGKALQATCQIH